MSFFAKLFGGHQVSTANQAKERLQVVVSHQRRHRSSPDYLPMLEKDIMAAIAKYVTVDDDMVDIKFHRSAGQSTLEVNVDLPDDLGSGPGRSKTENKAKDDDDKPSSPTAKRDGRLELVDGKLIRKPATVD